MGIRTHLWWDKLIKEAIEKYNLGAKEEARVDLDNRINNLSINVSIARKVFKTCIDIINQEPEFVIELNSILKTFIEKEVSEIYVRIMVIRIIMEYINRGVILAFEKREIYYFINIYDLLHLIIQDYYSNYVEIRRHDNRIEEKLLSIFWAIVHNWDFIKDNEYNKLFQIDILKCLNLIIRLDMPLIQEDAIKIIIPNFKKYISHTDGEVLESVTYLIEAIAKHCDAGYVSKYLADILELFEDTNFNVKKSALKTLGTIGNISNEYFTQDQIQFLINPLNKLLEKNELMLDCLKTVKWIINDNIKFFNQLFFVNALKVSDEDVLFLTLEIFGDVLRKGGSIKIHYKRLQRLIEESLVNKNRESRYINSLFQILQPIIILCKDNAFIEKIFVIFNARFKNNALIFSEELIDLIGVFGSKIKIPKDIIELIKNIYNDDSKTPSILKTAFFTLQKIEPTYQPRGKPILGDLYNFISLRKPASLSIIKQRAPDKEAEKKYGEMYAIDFLRPFELSSMGPLLKEISEKLLEGLNKDLSQITQRINSLHRKIKSSESKNEIKKTEAVLIQEFRTLGKILYDLSMPDSFTDEINETECMDLSLGVDSRLLGYPWEIMFDGKQYFGLRFGCGRIIKSAEFLVDLPSLKSRKKLKMLIIGNPGKENASLNLPGAEEEAIKLSETISEKGIEINLLIGADANSFSVIKELQAGYDFIHYSGHANFDFSNHSKSGLLLSDGLLSAVQINTILQRTLRKPILSFINGCESSKTEEWETTIYYVNQVSGLAEAFIKNGINYIGSLWPIHDEPAVDIAINFYDNILSRETSFGEGLRAAKEYVFNKFGESKIIWAGYILYGEPSLTIKYE